MDEPVIIPYHGGCKDGFMAVTIGTKKFGDRAVPIPMSPNEKTLTESIERLPYPSDITVYCYDISFTRKTLDLMIKKYPKVKIFDHHKTTRDAIAEDPQKYSSNVHVDITKSGAVLVWEHLFPDEEIPLVVKYIQDRDLFANSMARTEEVNTWLWTCYPCEHSEVARWLELLKDSSWLENAVIKGSLILKTHRDLMADIVKTATYRTIEGFRVACVETNLFRTDIGALLYNKDPPKCDYVIIWRVDLSTEKVFVSLRSKKGGFDVEEVARKFGGGGHKEAAGFETDIDTFFRFVLGKGRSSDIFNSLWGYVSSYFW